MDLSAAVDVPGNFLSALEETTPRSLPFAEYHAKTPKNSKMPAV